MTASDTSLDGYLATLRTEIDAALERVLGSLAAPPVIADPVRYALVGGGKRLRPCLTLAAAESIGPDTPSARLRARAHALPAACAVEMIHTYSLVHDDLPAMDDDALRRGRPTTHVVYGDGLAILTGDGLLTEAFRVLADWPSPALEPDTSVPPPAPALTLRAIGVVAAAAGVSGMVGGQAIDLSSAGRPPARRAEAAQATGEPGTMTAEALEDMHLRKTGALFRAASTSGAIMAGATEDVVAAIDDYARELGLAFQIVDDILDVEGSKEVIGKTAGKDAAAGKLTFPALYGIAGSRQRAADRVGRAKAALARHAISGRLADVADWTLNRVR